MKLKQIMLVQSTWELVHPNAETAAQIFYNKLFELDPSLRGLFRNDIAEQGKLLLQMMGIAVRGLDQASVLLPIVRTLGRRHAVYGVQSRHYDLFGEAFMWMLKSGLAERFTTEVEAAWAAAYQLISRTMQSASDEVKTGAVSEQATA